MLKSLAGTLAALMATCLPAAQASPARLAQLASPEVVASVQELRLEAGLQQALQTGDFVGLAVAVVRKGEITFIRTYGETQIGGGEAVTPDTVFRIASLSKGFASSMVAIAVAEGRLSLDAPATGIAPELALAGGGEKSLTLAHILSHRTGLPPNAYDNLLEGGAAPAEILPMLRKVKSICPVAGCYAYQNITFDLAGRALSDAYGMSYTGLVEQRLFRPLNMHTASFGLEGLKRTNNWARPHTRRHQSDASLPPHPWTVLEVRAPYYAVPASGGVNASILDMAQWLKAQLRHRPDVLAPDALGLVHAPQVGTPGETRRMRGAAPALRASHYGLGWRVYDYAGHKVVAHGGSVDGYGAQIMFVPELDTGIVVLSSTRTTRLWTIAPMFLELTFGLPPRDWTAPGAAR